MSPMADVVAAHTIPLTHIAVPVSTIPVLLPHLLTSHPLPPPFPYAPYSDPINPTLTPPTPTPLPPPFTPLPPSLTPLPPLPYAPYAHPLTPS